MGNLPIHSGTQSTWTYTYQNGNNRLASISVSGLTPPNCHEGDGTYSYTYDGNGNLKEDSRKGIGGVTYGRANLPWQITITTDNCDPETGQSIKYLYDGNDARIFKHTEQRGSEYYLRDAAGHELAVYNKSLNKLTWYVYGNERIAKLDHQPEIELEGCTNEAPTCTPAAQLAQEASLSTMFWIQNPYSLTYPTRLFRVKLCSGTERYVLLSELADLQGNYDILQQIDLTHAHQDFEVRSGNGPITFTDLHLLLFMRLTDFELSVNAYDACNLDACISTFQACSNEMTREQMDDLADLGILLDTYDYGTTPLPTNLMRIRICDGRELYVLPIFLSYVGNYYTIVDQIEVTDYSQTFTVTYPNGTQVSVPFEDLELGLFEVGQEITINEYESCLDELPCDDAPVSCEPPYAAQAQEEVVLPEIQSYIQTILPSAIPIPNQLHRVRFCSGLELYLFQSELSLITSGGYKILQTIAITDANQSFTVNSA
ncbi:MAG: hypothetical protein KDC44_13325, partial [Phaeodactylibacter sp.]|nr:hypothetical protein [Phaeodactylibacter sp.]